MWSTSLVRSVDQFFVRVLTHILDRNITKVVCLQESLMRLLWCVNNRKVILLLMIYGDVFLVLSFKDVVGAYGIRSNCHGLLLFVIFYLDLVLHCIIIGNNNSVVYWWKIVFVCGQGGNSIRHFFEGFQWLALPVIKWNLLLWTRFTCPFLRKYHQLRGKLQILTLKLPDLWDELSIYIL